jgi:DNA sulfur modification protein DndB
MLSNIESVDDLRGLARSKNIDYVTKTVNLSLVEEALTQGWNILKKNEKTVRLKKKKAPDVDLADRVWFLLYRMGFTYLNDQGNALLAMDPRDPNGQIYPIDVVGIDTEVGLAIKCKSSESSEQLRQELDQYILIRQRFSQSVNQQFSQPFDRQVKRQVALAVFTFNILLSEDDKRRAKEGNIVLFDEADLTYYEGLVAHLGPAAKYQFLADMLPGKNIPGLNMRVPAVRAKMGGYTCYTFSIPPEYLLKIGYVSHRSKGRGSDVSTYQRMIQKSRLLKIRKYIDENGIFPTNIVINFDKKPNFDRGEQEAEQESGLMGWLDIRSAYKSAWIIDGQHRLFAYSGHPKATKARLSVMAFEALPASMQAKMFIDINAEQKSVRQSLLQELYADLHKNAKEPALRVRSIVAQAIISLDDPKSVFYQRIQTANETKDAIRCISLTSIFRALADTDFYIVGARKEHIGAYGPLWSDEGNDATRKRTEYILNNWFGIIQAAVPEWWNVGAGEGGGLAMNDGVTACINVLRSVFQHLTARGENLVLLGDQELFEQVRPYAIVLGNYFRSLSEEDRKRFRALRGNQGQIARTKRCQQAIHESIPTFDPPGLREFMETEKAQTNIKAKAIVDRIEKILQKTVLEELQREFGPDETQWWTEGIPKAIRIKVTQRYEDDDAKRGGKEYYFDLIDYRTILTTNWDLFNKLLGYGKLNSGKDKRTAWINEVNECRRIVAHGSSGRSVTLDQLAQLEEYEQWLNNQIMQANESEDTPLDEAI